MIQLPYVREGSKLHFLVGELGKKVRIVSRLTNLSVSWHNYENWQSYYRGRSSKDRQEDRRRRRQLDERGRVTFEVIEGEKCAAAIDWALANKVRQLAQTNRRVGGWLKTRDYRNLLAEVASRSSHEGRIVVFVLKLDDQIIATLIGRVDKVRIEGLSTVYDADYRRYAPGRLLLCDVLRWAFERRLDYDLRGGDEPYKKRWANRESAVFTCEVVNSALYALYGWSPTVRPFIRGYRVAKRKLGQYVMDKFHLRLL